MLLRKGAYPYEYMDSWEKFDETALPPKKDYYSNLTWEHISDEDYAHTQKVREVFKIKNLGKYHDLYVQSDALLLADVYENFRNMCLEKHQLDSFHFLSPPRLVCLKKRGVNFRIINRCWYVIDDRNRN